MKRLVFGLTTMVCAVVLLAGCDDDGNAFTLDAYFEKVEGFVEDYEADQNDAFTTLNESTDLDELKDAFESIPDNLSTFLDEMRALSPPDEAAEAHDDVVDAGDAFLERLEEVNEDVQETTTVDAFIEAADSDELQGLSAEFNATCPPLQDVATENDIDVDLNCPGE